MRQVELIATAAFGLEAIVAHELRQLGYQDLQVENGKVTFFADITAIPRCNLWLRSADRLLLKLGEFEARSFDELFEKTKALNWNDWIPAQAKFPVEGKSIKSKLFSVPDCQAIVKKAIVEKMKEKYQIKWFEEIGPRYRVEVALLSDRALLTIDTSGAGLHKRGYRKLSGEAPLKETLAAALINISRWKPDRALIDPFCGSGTIPIEAALIGRNIAPGLGRDFVAESWPQIPGYLWQQCREEAQDLIRHDQPLGIRGTDIDANAIKLAHYHSQQAGLHNLISFQQQDARELNSRYKYGYLIANPPYGERLAEKEEVESLYRTMPQVFQRLDTWSFYILTAHPALERLIKRKSSKRRKVYNGRIQCTYYQFFGPRPDNLQGPFAID
ncbi:MAG: class I SAM-dependent RNA methyltransferase [Syntrophomonadaceae bacterium]|jgi:putative N6-adenine-specific DNA methylase|nr:class I SAM-dependent RNA methyltransferase [Syntrophomonadaceae bacterium]